MRIFKAVTALLVSAAILAPSVSQANGSHNRGHVVVERHYIERGHRSNRLHVEKRGHDRRDYGRGGHDSRKHWRDNGRNDHRRGHGQNDHRRVHGHNHSAAAALVTGAVIGGIVTILTLGHGKRRHR